MHADLTIVSQLGLILSAAALLALLCARLRIPSVIAYLATGVLLGPPGLGLLDDAHALQTLAEVGVVLLLFTIGLEFDLRTLAKSWRAVLLGGGGQVTATVAGTAGVAWLLGATGPEAITWGFLVALSSTAVVLRDLESRGETRTTHGRLITGVLIFQDLTIVPMMMLLPVLAGGAGGALEVLGVFGQAALVVGAVLVGARPVVGPLLARITRNTPREVFLLAVLGLGSLVAWAVSLAGLSFALGAFLAGMILADTEYSHQALGDVLPLRAVMMCVFFVGVGMLLDPAVITSHPGLVLALLAGLVGLKLALTWVSFLLVRFEVTHATRSALALAQGGEFGLVLAGAAQHLDLISTTEEHAFLAAAVLSIALSPVLVGRAPRLVAGRAVQSMRRLLDGTDSPEVFEGPASEPTGHVVVAGLGVGGRAVVEALESAGVPVVVVELNPDTVRAQRALGRRVVFGDVTSETVLAHAGLSHARAIVITISDAEAAHRAALHLHHHRPDVPVLVRTRWASDEGALRSEGLAAMSEEFAGAVTMAAMTLRTLGIDGWSAILARQLDAHERLGPDDEGTLDEPPPRADAGPEDAATPPGG